MRDACEDGARARDARGEGRGELAWGGRGTRAETHRGQAPPPARSPGDSDGKADRYGTVFELFGAQKREGRRKTPGRENRSGFAWAQTVP